MSNYKILGRSGAGSLIPEFLLTELEIDYDIEFPKSADLQNEKYIGFNPLGKTPVLICPNGLKIFETVNEPGQITALELNWGSEDWKIQAAEMLDHAHVDLSYEGP